MRRVFSRPGNESRGPWTALLAPGSVVLILFFIIPLLLVVVFSVGTINALGQPEFGHTLANFRSVFQDYNLAPLLRTILFTAVSTVVCLVLGYPVAYLAARFARRAGPLILALVVLPWLVDYLVRIYAWQSILAPAGLLAAALGHVGLGAPHLINTNWAVICGLVYGYLPLMILPIYASVSELRSEVIEAGKDLYGSAAAVFWKVTFPLTRDGVLGGCLLVALPMLGDFATAQFLGGPNSTMLGNMINDQFTDAGSQTVGSALVVALIALLVLTLVIAMLLGRRRVRMLSVMAPAARAQAEPAVPEPAAGGPA
jgi:spermidine/putrescine transport system permease protein